MVLGIDASRANVPVRTGPERYAFEVIRRLPTLFPTANFRMYVREPLRLDWGTLPSNVEVRVLKWPLRLAWGHIRLGWELLLHPPRLLFVPASSLPWGVRCPVVTTIHDVGFERYPEAYSRAPIFPSNWFWHALVEVLVRVVTGLKYGDNQLDYQRWSVRRALKKASRIITVSDFSKQEIVSRLHFSSDRIDVTPLGLSSDAETMTASREVLARPPIQQPYMLSVGRLDRKKNIDGLLRVYKRYREISQQPVDLVLVGAVTPDWEKIKRIIPDDWVGTCVQVVGQISDDEKAGWLRSAILYAAFSRYEGFGLAPLEAAAAGVAVVANDIPVFKEVLGDAALYVHPDNVEETSKAIDALLTDKSRLEGLGTLGASRAATLTFDDTALATVRSFQRVLS